MLETIAEKVIGILIEHVPEFIRKVQSKKEPTATLKDYGYLLSGRLVYLLRYLDQTGDARYPDKYGRVLMAYVEAGDPRPTPNYAPQAEKAWENASKYACWYLSSLGVVSQYGALGGEVAINDIGREVLRVPEIREKFRSAFDQPISNW